jgi:succinate dehydrogenase/fumarate reductase flavoprotein subunit
MDSNPDGLVLNADVLVIGGSLAGAWAALSARSRGARVVLAEKGFVGTAGVVAAANCGGQHTVPNDPEASEKVVHSRHAASLGLDDLGYARRVYDATWVVGKRLEELGFVSSRGPAAPGRSLASFRGPYSLHFLRTELLKAGVMILDHSPALELLSRDGVVSGARGTNRQTEVDWTVHAKAVILATGGNAFRSGAMGTNGLTGEGHLMAAEAGADLAGMEFSGHYGIVPHNSSISKGFWYSSATFWDGNGRELSRNGWESVPDVAQAILDTGKVWAQMNRGSEHFEAAARRASPNTFLYFDRLGIDPVRERFPVELVYEGTVRATGGLKVDADAHTGVPGLWAAGDVTERLRLTGASMSGAGPAISWCLASGEWSGAAAANFAKARGKLTGSVQALGGAGLRPTRSRSELATSRAFTGIAQAEILPVEKNVFRTLGGIGNSLERLDQAWSDLRANLQGGTPRERVAAREAAALVQGARWIYSAARVRTESRGLHRLRDFPDLDPIQTDRIELSGLDRIDVRRVPTSFAPAA